MAKMTGKGLGPDVIFGGITSIDRMDVAAACSNLSDLEYYLVRVKYCGDLSSVSKAVSLTEEYLSAESTKLAELDQPRRGAMASLMIQELVTENRCRKCQGSGRVAKKDKSLQDCPSCEGSGRRTPSTLGRANSCGIPESTWRHQRLGEVFDRILGKLEVAEAHALDFVSRKVS